MIALIQRVSRAQVDVAGQCVGSAGRGILALIGIEAGDDEATGRKLLERVLTYRIFPDDAGKMNLDVRQIDGDLLLIPQFTLVADTRKGTRPSFSEGAPPALAQELFGQLLEAARQAHPSVASGVFGADMQVSLTNDGPVTFTLRVSPPGAELSGPAGLPYFMMGIPRFLQGVTEYCDGFIQHLALVDRTGCRHCDLRYEEAGLSRNGRRLRHQEFQESDE